MKMIFATVACLGFASNAFANECDDVLSKLPKGEYQAQETETVKAVQFESGVTADQVEAKRAAGWTCVDSWGGRGGNWFYFCEQQTTEAVPSELFSRYSNRYDWLRYLNFEPVTKISRFASDACLVTDKVVFGAVHGRYGRWADEYRFFIKDNAIVMENRTMTGEQVITVVDENTLTFEETFQNVVQYEPFSAIPSKWTIYTVKTYLGKIQE